jgi:nitroreductase
MDHTDNPVLRALAERRSVRKFTGEPVEPEEVRAMLEAGRWAPSGLNNQPWRFLALPAGDERVEKLAGCTRYGAIVRAAAVLVAVFLDRGAMYNELKDHQTAGACIQNMLLAAHAQGLGAVWLGEIVNQADQVLDVLSMDPVAYSFMALVAVGRPAHPGASSRHPLSHFMLEEF